MGDDKWRSKTCEGEVCRCGRDAYHKVEEVVFRDDPNPIRHPLVAYVCPTCFDRIMGRDRFPVTEEEQDVIQETLRDLLERDPKAHTLLNRIVHRATSDFQPDWASPPGDTIKDLMKDRGMSEADLCREMTQRTSMHVALVPPLLEGHLVIDEQRAQALAEVFDVSVQFWRNREFNYRASLARLQRVI